MILLPFIVSLIMFWFSNSGKVQKRITAETFRVLDASVTLVEGEKMRVGEGVKVVRGEKWFLRFYHIIVHTRRLTTSEVFWRSLSSGWSEMSLWYIEDKTIQGDVGIFSGKGKTLKLISIFNYLLNFWRCLTVPQSGPPNRHIEHV